MKIEGEMIKSRNKHGLPLPRLEFNWSKKDDSWEFRICDYYLVLPLGTYDIRAEGDDEDGEHHFGFYNEFKVLIGKTKVEGGNDDPPIHDGKVDTPFRDTAHIQYDNRSLGGHLPMYAVCENEVTKLKMTINGE